MDSPTMATFVLIAVIIGFVASDFIKPKKK